jgi:EAL domain-containing protein (putative c-di-GMP-specific phosphodiesterase class I)/GGDEF domain-containing protein
MPGVDVGHQSLDLQHHLDELMVAQAFTVHFQPIVDLDSLAVMGHEALTRGPANSPLHSPLVLFELAARFGKLIQLERLLVRLIARRFVELALPGRLFINVTADTLTRALDDRASLEWNLTDIGLEPRRVVVELTETRPILDLDGMRASLDWLKTLGFSIALDDLGEGFAGLRRWSELRPHFVKIDRHFIDGVAVDPLKLQFVRSITEMAATSGATVIAEGLEDEGDLRVLSRMGVTLFQGYLLGRPQAVPRGTLRADLPMLLDRIKLDLEAHPSSARAEPTAGDLARPNPTLTPAQSCRDAIALLQTDAFLNAIPVLDDYARPLGVLRAAQVFRRSSERYFDDLFGRKSCVELMDAKPLVFDVSASLRQMSEAVANQDERLLGDGFLITRNGAFCGVGKSSDLMRAVSDLQVQTAQHANPLSGLPGNIAIERHLDALLNGSASFVVVHWDLAHFKAFNDEYGFAAGDDMIRLTANLLRGEMDPYCDFVGHIGGDDFVQVLMGPLWEQQLHAATQTFDAKADALFRSEHLRAGGIEGVDRQGRHCFHPLSSLRGGVLQVEPGQFPSARAIATAMTSARKESKRLGGRSGVFVERRRAGGLDQRPAQHPDPGLLNGGQIETLNLVRSTDHACNESSPKAN